MATIKFANGEMHECSYHGSVQDGSVRKAMIAITDSDFLQVAKLFTDTEKTAEMECDNVRMIGYTELIMIGVQPYGIQAVLRGGHDERIY